MELVRSSISINGGLPCETVGSAPAVVFSRPAQRSLTLWPARSPSRQATLFIERSDSFVACAAAFDCYWVERTSSRAGVTPAEVQRLSRRTVSPTSDIARWHNRFLRGDNSNPDPRHAASRSACSGHHHRLDEPRSCLVFVGSMAGPQPRPSRFRGRRSSCSRGVKQCAARLVGSC